MATTISYRDLRIMDLARDRIDTLARRQATLTTDDVWAAIGSPADEPRILGNVMRQAAQDGVIAAIDRYIPSTRPECHCRPVRVWRSLVFSAPAVVAA